jgi:hypothetical protein
MKRSVPVESTSTFIDQKIKELGGLAREDARERVRNVGSDGTFPKAKAPSIARGFEILDDVRQTLTTINGSVELSRLFGVEWPEECKGVEP